MTTLPNEVLTAFNLGGARIFKTTDKSGRAEWHTSCARCGGKDRFVIREWREYPHWLVMCRQCAPEWVWLDQAAPMLRQELTPEQRQEYARRRAEAEQQRQVETQKRLAEFTTAELWMELNRRMSEDNREWWRRRGVPDEWQDYLRLGYIPDKPYRSNEVLYHSPAYTIPYLRGDLPVTMQYRLVSPADPGDKYRFEAGLPAAWYDTTPTRPLSDEVVICEGAIKAMATKVYSGIKESVSVLAVPAKRSWAGVAQVVANCGRVWVMLDPDGTRDARDLAHEIGKAARVVLLPGKVDDALVSGDLTTDELRKYFRYAAA